MPEELAIFEKDYVVEWLKGRGHSGRAALPFHSKFRIKRG
jgi:hypothetical protein